MPVEVKIEHVLKLEDLVGKGPLKTQVYKGTYGINTSKLFDNARKTARNNPKDVLIKAIRLKIMSNSVDWKTLQSLNHPNLATYILVHEEGLFNPVVYIVQDLHTNTLIQFAEWTGEITGVVLKRAVKHILSGLQYLHSHTPAPIIHKNLKPSNVLVKGPLLSPSGFVLTDYWYSQHSGIPQRNLMCGLLTKERPDCHDITCWMSPELLANKNSQSTPMMDIFSFGMTLKYLLTSSNDLPFDELEETLFQQLVEEMIEKEPSYRISCAEIENHPLLALNPSWNESENAEARIRYITRTYDEIIKMDKNKSSNVSEQVEKVTHLLASDVFPWSGEESEDSFSRRIFHEMNQHATKPFDPDSFMDLLRLVSESGEILATKKEFERLRQEIAEDAFSKSFAFIIPLVYISMSTFNSMKIRCSEDKYKSHRAYSIGSIQYSSNERKKRRNK
ncbi:hypothetical protein ACHWQZ_G006493 [Mnemiopsis leidyi]